MHPVVKKPLFITAVILSACVVHMPVSHAQEVVEPTAVSGSGSMHSGSGADMRTIQQRMADMRALAPTKNPIKLKDIAVQEQKQKAWENESATTRKRLWEHRAECREAIRRANRDQLMDRVLACYRADLLLDITLMRKQAQYINAIPLINPQLAASATGAIAALTDAEMTIVNAIDAGLFEQPASMEEAKRNLRANYREQYWLQIMKLRADRELTWLIYMSKYIHSFLPEEGRTDAVGILAANAGICMENAAKLLVGAMQAPDRASLDEPYSQGRALAQECRKTLKKAVLKEQQLQAEKAPNME